MLENMLACGVGEYVCWPGDVGERLCWPVMLENMLACDVRVLRALSMLCWPVMLE